jgi:hypothetical protein
MRIKRKCLGIFVGIIWGITLTPAHPDSLFGEFKRLPDDIERGFSLGADFGVLFLTNDIVKNPGFQMCFTTGYDLSKYLSLEGVYTLGINEAPINKLYKGGIYTVLADLAVKGQYPLGRLYPFVEIGGGIFYSRPEVEVSKNYKVNIMISAGAEYYTYLRHYSLYAKTSYFYITGVDTDAITMSGGLKYTF